MCSRSDAPESHMDEAIDEVEFDCISSLARSSYVGHILRSLLFRVTLLFVLCLFNEKKCGKKNIAAIVRLALASVFGIVGI